MMVNAITMLIFANYLLGMNENQTSISKSQHKQYTLRINQNEKRKKRNNQRKRQTFIPKEKIEG
jgi:hypothetical protein